MYSDFTHAQKSSSRAHSVGDFRAVSAKGNGLAYVSGVNVGKVSAPAAAACRKKVLRVVIAYNQEV